MSEYWNPWHGCKKISPGCANCYVYRTDAKFSKDSSKVTKNSSFYLPSKKKRNGEFAIPPGETVYTCFTSDFLLAEADEWRKEAWEMIKNRPDLTFLFITKRIDRLKDVLPDDWADGYKNVIIGCTAENREMADFRLPIFLSLPIYKRIIICEPLLEEIDLSPYLSDKISEVVAGGESGDNARMCDYNWVLNIRDCCIKHNVSFTFKQTGARFKMNEKVYRIERKFQHSQAKKANINFISK